MNINQRTGVSTFASCTSPSTDQSLQKSFHLSHADKIELKKISSPSENKKYATAQPSTTKTMTVKLNNDNGLLGRRTEGLLLTAVWRNGGFSASYDSFVVGSSAVLRLNICAKNPPLRQAAKRCGAIRRHIGSPDCMRRCGLERLTSAHLRDFSADRSFATPAPKPRKSGDPLAVIINDKTTMMTSKEIITAHLTTNYINQNGLTFFSGLCGGLKDARKMSGRHMDTGAKFPSDIICSTDENSPCFKGHLGSWLGTMGYMALFDQIGKCYRPKNKTKITDNSSSIKKCLNYFTSLSTAEINSLYALRNAFFHDFSIFHKFNNNKDFFLLGHHPTAPILKLPTVPWDGDYNNIKPENQTWANLEAIGDLVEKIYKDLLDLASKDELEIELDGGANELFVRYIFVTGVKVK